MSEPRLVDTLQRYAPEHLARHTRLAVASRYLGLMTDRFPTCIRRPWLAGQRRRASRALRRSEWLRGASSSPRSALATATRCWPSSNRPGCSSASTPTSAAMSAGGDRSPERAASRCAGAWRACRAPSAPRHLGKTRTSAGRLPPCLARPADARRRRGLSRAAALQRRLGPGDGARRLWLRHARLLHARRMRALPDRGMRRGLKVASEADIMLSTERLLAMERREFPDWEPDLPDFAAIRREAMPEDVLIYSKRSSIRLSPAVQDDLIATSSAPPGAHRSRRTASTRIGSRSSRVLCAADPVPPASPICARGSTTSRWPRSSVRRSGHGC